LDSVDGNYKLSHHYGTHRNAAEIDISSQHENGVQIALCDGSVRYFSNRIDQEVLTKVCFRADGTLVTLPLQ
jgi:prepilin-type processing-associated H-X9-DG protein